LSYDLDLLRIAFNKEKYERFKEVVKKHNISSTTLEVFNILGLYWDNYPGRTDVDLPSLETFFYIVSGKKLKDPEKYDLLFTNLKDKPPSHIEGDVLQHLITLDYASRIYDEVLGVSVGTAGKHLTNIAPILDEYNKEVGKASPIASLFVPASLGYISGMVSSPGLSWRIAEMNVSLGPLRKGDFMILGARPETGKTTFIASESTFMLQQLKEDEHVIWINNEEASAKVMARCIQAFFGVTTGELMANTATYEEKWLAAGGSRFLILDDDSSINSPTKLDKLFRDYKPGLIIFDQLDKVHGFKNDREDLRIGALYEWARGLAKTHCPVIAVSQLDGTAEGEKYPGMEKLRGSKTDKPGEADAVVLIGNEKDGTLNRYLSIDKNKLFGGPRSNEAHRHGKFELSIDAPRARYISKWKSS
jgi:replicative DNA helicase